MGGPGLLALLGQAKAMPEVNLPTEKKTLVDVEAFHKTLTRAAFNQSTTFNSIGFAKNFLLRKFSGHDVEYFVDGFGNLKKLRRASHAQQQGGSSSSSSRPSRSATQQDVEMEDATMSQ